MVTPDERKASSIVHALQEADGLGQEITYVLIPADTSKPLKQLTCKMQSTGGDVLLTELKSAFAAKSDQVDLDLLQTPTLAANEAAQVSQETLQKVAQEAHVESFALVHPQMSNNFTGVNLYLDEIGMLKRLKLNKRASDFASRAGYNPPPQFYGDVFLGRVKAMGGRLVNVSLTLEEANLQADWLQSATMDNLNHQMQMNEITGSKAGQPSVAGLDASKHEDGYEWRQTEEELEVTLQLPTETTSKSIKVNFRPTLLDIQCTSSVSIPLFERIDVDSGTWTLESSTGGKKKLVISVEKAEAALWPRIRD